MEREPKIRYEKPASFDFVSIGLPRLAKRAAA